MRTFLITHVVFAAAVCLLTVHIAEAQDAELTLPTLPTADTGTLPEPTAPQVPLTPALADPEPAPPVTVPWTWQHQTQNQQGTVTNLHERSRSEDGNAYNYQHSATRPNGEHTQLREYSQTDEGYQLLRQQRFYTPDGTMLREHSMSTTGTDPYNYQRQMTHTFRDGRTMEQTFTRSYDGTTGTMQRSFLGPNGQMREFERPWTPDDIDATYPGGVDPIQLPTPQQAGLPTADPMETALPPIVDPLAPTTASKTDEGFLSWLNPFKKRDSNPAAGSSNTAKRTGFTIGSFGRSRQMDKMPPGQARKASGLSHSSQMRSMNAKLKQTGPPPHAAASLPKKVGTTH